MSLLGYEFPEHILKDFDIPFIKNGEELKEDT